MPDERDDESLGLEHLPQAELDSTPGAAEEPSSDAKTIEKGSMDGDQTTQMGSAKPPAENDAPVE